jgi:hypothetical protein
MISTGKMTKLLDELVALSRELVLEEEFPITFGGCEVAKRNLDACVKFITDEICRDLADRYRGLMKLVEKGRITRVDYPNACEFDIRAGNLKYESTLVHVIHSDVLESHWETRSNYKGGKSVCEGCMELLPPYSPVLEVIGYDVDFS